MCANPSGPTDLIACDHSSAIWYFINSIVSPDLFAPENLVTCSSYENLASGCVGQINKKESWGYAAVKPTGAVVRNVAAPPAGVPGTWLFKNRGPVTADHKTHNCQCCTDAPPSSDVIASFGVCVFRLSHQYVHAHKH